jgi:hypothetical protein
MSGPSEPLSVSTDSGPLHSESNRFILAKCQASRRVLAPASGHPTVYCFRVDLFRRKRVITEAATSPQMSPDRRFWWDGHHWRDARLYVPADAPRSADNHYWWDGSSWQRGPDIEARMRPGGWSGVGFLGPDESLEEVLVADADTLRGLALEARTLADALHAVIRSHLAGNGRDPSSGYVAGFLHSLGHQACPWAERDSFATCPAAPWDDWGSFNWRIMNVHSGDEMTGPGLIVHLIAGHGFFEGRKSAYRVDPLKLARLLDLV